MKKTLTLMAAAAVLSLGTSLSLAQVTIDLAPEVRTQFHEHVVTEKVEPVELQTEVTVGAAVPADVTLQPVPDVIVEEAPDLEGHQYFLVGESIYVVEPDSRKVVTVIER
jgi:hypothetical protein